MEIFRAEKICVVEDNSSRACQICGQKMRLVRTVVHSNTGDITHLFECPCAHRLWVD
jgi:ribosomal protein L28